jgi:hypothetical protein
MFNYKNVFFSITFILVSFFSTAQNIDTIQSIEPEYGIKVLAKVAEDEIMLRWAPDNPITWHYANQYGYTIIRYTLFRDNAQLNPADEKVLSDDPVKPKAKDDWEGAEINKYNAAAWQAIYGETFDMKESSNEMVRIMDKTNEMLNRYSFALFACDHSPQAAEFSGLLFRDTNIKQNEKYLYRVIANIPKEIIEVDTGFYYIDAGQITEYPKPLELTATFKDRITELRWNQFYYQGIYTSWSVERSADDGKTFERINKNPLVNLHNQGRQSRYMYFNDSLPENDLRYVYRVIGHSAFGDDGPPSDTISGYGKEDLKAFPVLGKTLINDKGEALISWEFPEDLNNKLKGFTVSRGTKAKGKFIELNENLIPPKDRLFLDQNPSSTNYYKVTAVDKHGRTYKSQAYLVQLADSIPPEAPVGLTGFIDSTGVVHIAWTPNKEEDLFGYRVYMTNHMNSEFSQITRKAIRDTSFQFKTTLKTLTEDMFLKVMAEDNRFNPSDYSEHIKVTRPDTIPPAPPVIKGYTIKDECIELRWAKSMSSDVVKHIIQRTKAGKNDWQTLVSIGNEEAVEFWCDSSAVPGVMYEYNVAAVDEAGNISRKGKSIHLQMSEKKVVGAVKNFKGSINRDQNKINLTWALPDKEIKLIYIYRKEGDGPLKTYKTFNKGTEAFTDEKVFINTTYEYAVRLIYTDGKSSKFSERIVINY